MSDAAANCPVRLQLLLEARVPAQALAVALFLLWREEMERPAPNAADIAVHFGVKRQTAMAWANDLETLGLAKRERDGRRIGYRLNCPVRLQVPRRDDGKVARCAVRTCRRPTSSGTWCPRHKQTVGRKDRQWWRRAEHLLRQGISPVKAVTMLHREGFRDAHMWDLVPEEGALKQPGIVSRGLMLGLLDDDWAERQKEYFSGGGPDE